MAQETHNEQPAKAEKDSLSGLENKPFSQAVQQKKEMLYGQIPVSRKQIDIILWVAVAALAVVIILIALEAAGIYKIG